MAKARYARIVDGAVAEIREFGRAPDPNPKKGLDWRLCPIGTRPAYDPETEVLSGPTYEIGETVVETFSKRAKTAEELDADKDSRLSRHDMLSFEVNFDQENRIRALEGRQAVTKAQYLSLIHI